MIQSKLTHFAAVLVPVPLVLGCWGCRGKQRASEPNEQVPSERQAETLPAPGTAPGEPARDDRQVEADLRRLAKAVLMYADDWQGWLPPPEQLHQLSPYAGYGRGDEQRWRELTAKKVFLFGNVNLFTVRSPSRVIVVYDQPDPDAEYVWGAFLDGHSQRIPKAQFQERLESSRKALKLKR